MPVLEFVPRGAVPASATAPLSPWPDAAPAVAAAVARLRAAVQGAACDSDGRAAQLGAVASAMVEREAPGAPQAIRDEAVIRFAGYLAQSDFGAIRQETIGPMSTEYMTSHGMAFRHSGAKALLSPWKVRRAGAIG